MAGCLSEEDDDSTKYVEFFTGRRNSSAGPEVRAPYSGGPLDMCLGSMRGAEGGSMHSCMRKKTQVESAQGPTSGFAQKGPLVRALIVQHTSAG